MIDRNFGFTYLFITNNIIIHNLVDIVKMSNFNEEFRYTRI